MVREGAPHALTYHPQAAAAATTDQGDTIIPIRPTVSDWNTEICIIRVGVLAGKGLWDNG